MGPSKIIIDTDPGVDDILAILLALSASEEELEVLLISLTFGNIDVQNCLRNTVSLFKIVEQEQIWRKSQGRSPGFDSLGKCKPVLAVGADEPLHEQIIVSDYFYGADGLGGVHTSHPHFTPQESWQSLFSDGASGMGRSLAPACFQTTNFTPSKMPAHKEILRILRENPPQSVTIVAVGPLTNIALAADEDPETLVRAKEVVSMGGAIDLPGNVTPMAEFNFSADAFAAAKVFALTSNQRLSTMPPIPKSAQVASTSMFKKLSRQLDLTLLPLDLTVSHVLEQETFIDFIAPLLQAGSPLATWANAFVTSTFNKVIAQHPPTQLSTSEGDRKRDEKASKTNASLNMHDPLAIWYVLASISSSKAASHSGWVFSPKSDIRIEAVGQWTRGMCVIDRRVKPAAPLKDEVRRGGNNIRVCIKTGWEESFGVEMLRSIFL